ncbi:MAG: glycoside hydrolase [Candidatus Azobacteroides sp.]|nr:glycoside hydrolase [Candidatus Azobacteroides sp.]
MKRIQILILGLLIPFAIYSQERILLNGVWELGEGRVYNQKTNVPGIATDPAKMNEQTLWYKKEMILPKGNWTNATLELKGARFSPEVFVNGISVSKKNGGMAPTFHLLKGKEVKPGGKITLEIALTSLKNISPQDASYIPPVDQWRSNISSCLWDDVVLHLHGDHRIEKIIPDADIVSGNVNVDFYVENVGNEKATNGGEYVLSVYDNNNQKLFTQKGNYLAGKNTAVFNYKNQKLKEWSPENPQTYQLELTLSQGKRTLDQSAMTLGIKQFEVRNKQFYLNGEPYKLRGGTVVWHRWVRSEEGRVCGYDTTWFKNNIILRLKEHGANYLRFHLGAPPQRLLDLCDKYGLIVQYEWNFFHGMPATKESCIEQYGQWLAAAMRHPSIAIYHPYNETEGAQLQTVWEALDEILLSYPSLVLSERDIIHIHKYWWSLFENVGLYYDSYQQFDKAIMVDEFGGNYLDEKGDMGGYKSLSESYLRFLGRNHTAEKRLKHLALANGKISEYWRRIGAAGVAPFCIASSWEDGNTWFMGPLSEGNPKTVWADMTVAWSPQAVSIELWDKNFLPGQVVDLPIYFFNDEKENARLSAKLTIEDKFGKIYSEQNLYAGVNAFSQTTQTVKITLPEKTGDFIVKAVLQNRPEQVKYPVYSAWDVRTFRANVPEELTKLRLYIPQDETELLTFALARKLQPVTTLDKNVKLMLMSKKSWDKIANNDSSFKKLIETAIRQGTSVVMLDVGERGLGQGYPKNEDDLGPLQGVAKIIDPEIHSYDLFGGITLTFVEAAEPETHLFPSEKNNALWKNIPASYSGFWNGLRGGLTVPASDMTISGLNSKAFLEQWKARGADENQIKSDSYYAYELQGFFDYSSLPEDAKVQRELRAKVAFLVEDAPALASSINPNTPVTITNLSQGYVDAQRGIAQNLTILMNAGKNLTRTPVVLIDFGEGQGKLLVSQLLTAGRLAGGFGEQGLYGIRYDETAVQTVLNMMEITN